MKLVEYKIKFFIFTLLTFVFSQSNQASCEFGSFANSLGKCMECLSSCPTCKSLTQICKKCTDGMKMKKNNLCISCNIGQKNCEEGNFQCMKFYTKQEGHCKPECTVKNCEKCTSTTSTVCQNCHTGFNLNTEKTQCYSNKRILEETKEKIMENSTGLIVNDWQKKNISQQLTNNASIIIDLKNNHQNNQNNNSHDAIKSESNLTNNFRNQSMSSVSQNSTFMIPTTAQNRSMPDSQNFNSIPRINPNTTITQNNSSSMLPQTNSTSQIINPALTPQISSLSNDNHTNLPTSLTPQMNSSANTNQTKSQTIPKSLIPEISSNQSNSNTSLNKNSTSQSNIFVLPSDTNSSTAANHTNLSMAITLQSNSSVRQNQTILNPQINQTSIPVQANISIGPNSQKIANSTSLLKDCGKDSLQKEDKCQSCNLKCGLCINTPNQCLECSEGYRKLGWKCMRTESIKFIIELEKKKNLSEINEDIYNVTKEIVSSSLPTQYEKNMSSVTLEQLKVTPMLINISGYIDCKLKNCSLPVLQNHINIYLEQKKSLNSMKINSFKLFQNVNGNDSQLLSKVYSAQTSKQMEQPKQPSQQTKTNPAAIILPIVLGLLFLALIIGSFLCYYYKKCCFKARSTDQTSYVYNQNQNGGKADTQRHLNRNRKTPTEVELDAIPDYVNNKQRISNERFADEKIQQFGNMESDI